MFGWIRRFAADRGTQPRVYEYRPPRYGYPYPPGTRFQVPAGQSHLHFGPPVLRRPQIKIELQDGTNTWVTTAPIELLHVGGATQAAGEAFTRFIANLVKDEDAVDRHLEAWRD